MAGQIFNMQEHWPSAVLLWAVGAVAGYLLLADWPHLAMSAILVPWWLAGEWVEAAPRTQGAWPVTACGILLAAICYLSVRMPGADSRENHPRVALTWIAGLALLPPPPQWALDRHTSAPLPPPAPPLLPPTSTPP